MKKVSLIIPCYNEEQSLPLLYEAICSTAAEHVAYEWEFLFVNDGSKDSTLEIIKGLRASDKRVSFVDLSRNFGKERAMLAGFDYAGGDCAIVMDADLQDPPEVVFQMMASQSVLVVVLQDSQQNFENRPSAQCGRLPPS